MLRSIRTLIGLAGGLIATAAGTAQATWSILIVDTRTGEIGLASATCLIRLDLRELTPVLISGVGGVTAQSAGDSTGLNRSLIRDRLIQGVALDDILAELAVFDAGSHQSRQYGMIDVTGDTLTFSGSNASDWAGGQTGQLGDIAWAVQGNILTGPNVVQDAVDAIVNTDGDLADKLMASMIAAREAGGDGRCSCAPTTPTACGSPPPGDFKSAHIGYMLIARIEDQDHSRVYYRDPGHGGHFATPDLNGDGLPDAVASAFNGPEVFAYLNDSAPGSRLASAVPAGSVVTGPGAIVRMTHADVNGDGFDDVVFATAGPDEIGYLPGDGAGGLGAAVRAALPGPVDRIDAGDLTGDGAAEIVVTVSAVGGVYVFSENAGTLTQSAQIDVPGVPTGVSIAQMDNAGLNDLVVATASDDSVAVLRNLGGLAFSTLATYTQAGLGPVDVAAGSIFGSGLGDVAVIGGTSRRLTVLRQDSPGVFSASTSTLVNAGRQVELGRFTPDGKTGIVTMAIGNRTIEIHAESATTPGAFESIDRTRAAPAQVALTVADLNQDGLDDLVSGGLTRGVSLIVNTGDGTFPEYEGFASGEYFMELNVADTINSSPDPVDQLVGQFADWRAGLEGKIDAVRSTVVAPSRVGAGQTYTLRAQARDWRGDPVAPALFAAEAFVVSGQATIAEVRSPALGVVEVDVVASAEPGVDLIGIRMVDGQDRPVRLMPDATVMALADLADFNNDGGRNFFDLGAFLAAFNSSDPAADLNGDQVFDAADVNAFVALFLAPAP
tara:strand:- start:24129 stop:26465 length:2337 start_codon:yes stop_codon:yes gene_type:complete